MSLTNEQAGAKARELILGLLPPGTPIPIPPGTGKVGLLVPLYTHPTNWVANGPVVGTWAELKKQALAHPTVKFIAIINPASGVGTVDSPEYSESLTELNQVDNIRIVGYIATAYGAIPEATVKHYIDLWYTWYPELGGIFFDEENYQPGGSGYYVRLTAYVKTKQSAEITIGNPGMQTLAEYIPACDITVIYESPGRANLIAYKTTWDSYDNDRLGMIPFEVSLDAAWLKEASGLVSWLYMTDDVLSNPWDSLPTYFAELCTIIDGLS